MKLTFILKILYRLITVSLSQCTMNYEQGTFYTQLQWSFYQKPYENQNNKFYPQSLLQPNYQNYHINTPIYNYNKNCRCSCRKCSNPKPCCKNLCDNCKNRLSDQGSYMIYPYPIPILIITNSTINSTETTNTITTTVSTTTAVPVSRKSKKQLKLTTRISHSGNHKTIYSLSTYISKEDIQLEKTLSEAKRQRHYLNERNQYRKKQQSFMKLRPNDVIYVPRPTVRDSRRMNNDNLINDFTNLKMEGDKIEILPIPDSIAMSILEEI